jgi:hypothetical protein
VFVCDVCNRFDAHACAQLYTTVNLTTPLLVDAAAGAYVSWMCVCVCVCARSITDGVDGISSRVSRRGSVFQILPAPADVPRFYKVLYYRTITQSLMHIECEVIRATAGR